MPNEYIIIPRILYPAVPHRLNPPITQGQISTTPLNHPSTPPNIYPVSEVPISYRGDAPSGPR